MCVCAKSCDEHPWHGLLCAAFEVLVWLSPVPRLHWRQGGGKQNCRPQVTTKVPAAYLQTTLHGPYTKAPCLLHHMLHHMPHHMLHHMPHYMLLTHSCTWLDHNHHLHTGLLLQHTLHMYALDCGHSSTIMVLAALRCNCASWLHGLISYSAAVSACCDCCFCSMRAALPFDRPH